MEIHHSLSTIAEESKSNPTVSSINSKATYTKRTDVSLISSGIARRSSPLPPLSNRLNPCKKRHTSYILKGTSREIEVPHVETFTRSPSFQERLMFQLETSKQPLFTTVVEETAKTAVPSILITGFGLRDVVSLQEALHADERTRLSELYRAQASKSFSSVSSKSFGSSEGSDVSCEMPSSKSTYNVQTRTDLLAEEPSQTQLSYLTGYSSVEADEEKNMKTEVGSVSVDFDIPDVFHSTSKSVRQAQAYLRIHRVFEFFQFIIAHLLSKVPDNPINFIINLLDRCLLYRSSLTRPPMLYGRRHLEVLFNLMDKMGTGYIDLKQYRKATRTLGICSDDHKSYTTCDGFITKDDFINTVYESLAHMLDDMIRRHWMTAHPPEPQTPTITEFSSTRSSCSVECTSFVRSEMFLKRHSVYK